MPPSKRIQVRPVPQDSLLEENLRRVRAAKKRVRVTKVHPLAVLHDLSKGSLKSLSRYLAQERGIPDRRIALELRKLISGSKSRTPYRLIVTAHPDLPKNEGGRPKRVPSGPTEKEQALAARFDEVLLEEGKRYVTLERVAKEMGVHPSTVERANRKVNKYAETERNLVELLARRSAALSQLRDSDDE